jgi:hypothetical protein
MKTLLIWACSFLIAGIIISPFFWLKFLKERGQWKYISVSILASFILNMLYIFKLGELAINSSSKLGTDFYYFFYDASGNAIIIMFFAILISPFFLTKNIFQQTSIKWIAVSCLLSVAIFIIYALVFVYIIFPMAAGVIFKNLN